MQFNLNMDEFESLQSLLARRAPVRDLLQNGIVSADIVRGTLILKNGSAKLYALKDLLKVHGCNFDAATKTWRRPSATVAERYAVNVMKARGAARNARTVDEKDAVIDAILAHVNAVDAERRNTTWVGMHCVPTNEVTPEVRARAWACHGLGPPTRFG